MGEYSSDSSSSLTDHEYLLFLLPFPPPDKTLARIRERYPGWTIQYVESKIQTSKDRIKVPGEIVRDVTILVTLFDYPSDPAKEAPRLKLVHVASAGIDKLEHQPIYTETDIPITNCSGIHGPQISEWIIMTTLIQNHGYKGLYESQKVHRWNQSTGMGAYDLVGQRLGILGYGSIGRQTARVAQAMGMQVLAYTASPRTTPESKKDTGFIIPGTGDPDGSIPSEWYSGSDKASLHNFLSQDLDVLVISVPLTKQTRHFLGAEEFSILGRHGRAFISNISRGAIIKQSDLIDALKANQLRGAALDVTEPEPLPPDDPLWDCPNVTITPHISGVTTFYVDRVVQVLELNLERMQKGEKLVNWIDRKKGY